MQLGNFIAATKYSDVEFRNNPMLNSKAIEDVEVRDSVDFKVNIPAADDIKIGLLN